jgi:hypothetical protein
MPVRKPGSEAASVGGLFHLWMRLLYVACWHFSDLTHLIGDVR